MVDRIKGFRAPEPWDQRIVGTGSLGFRDFRHRIPEILKDPVVASDVSTPRSLAPNSSGEGMWRWQTLMGTRIDHGGLIRGLRISYTYYTV